MKLDDSRRSDNVEDERGSAACGPRRRHRHRHHRDRGHRLFHGRESVDPAELVERRRPPGRHRARAGGSGRATANDPQVDFVRAILGETEDVWGAYFKNMGKTYIRPKLVLFSGQVASACGFASSAAGPFYCPGDQKVYIDLTFYRQLATEFGAPGDFARAYVIAHEVGHHVQNLLGITDKAAQAEQQRGPRRRAITCRLRWSCRRIASPACGPRRPTMRAKFSSPAIWSRG